MLFDKYKLKNTTLRNRIVMAPMTRSMSPGGVPTKDVVNYYQRRAKANVGLIITEGIEISHAASSAYPNVPRLDSEKAITGWKEVVSGIKNSGGAVVGQLWHCGGFRKPGMGPNPDVPGHTASGLTRPGKNVAHPMTIDDINQTIDAYAADAKRCEEIGFDGIEIHGAHGYLIDNFLWEGTNIRDDDYGGSIENRARLATEIVDAIRSNVSDDFIVGFRFSQWKQQDYRARLVNNDKELAEMLKGPTKSGLDYLHSSMRRYWEPEFKKSDHNLAYWTKKISKLPTISVGSVGIDSDFIDMTAPAKPSNIQKVINDINEGKYDLVAVGRALLADHEWALKMEEGRLDDIKSYNEDTLKTYF